MRRHLDFLARGGVLNFFGALYQYYRPIMMIYFTTDLDCWSVVLGYVFLLFDDVEDRGGSLVGILYRLGEVQTSHLNCWLLTHLETWMKKFEICKVLFP